MTEKETTEKMTPKRKLQDDLVAAVKKGDFVKTAKLRQSIANIK